METLEILVRIPKHDYDYILSQGDTRGTPHLAEALVNGTVLPKGHGNLIDKESLVKAIEQKAKRLENLDTINGLCGAVALAYEAETVIEADKEEKND